MDDLRIERLQQALLPEAEKSKGYGAANFSRIIEGAIKKVNGINEEADESLEGLLKGRGDIHETMIALQKADISMRLLLTFRNKAVEAYREIMHMQF